jgi:uncharacterized protein
MDSFQQYQANFTAHLRSPSDHPAPAGVDDARMAIYREIVFNNLLGVVSACFPVCQEILGEAAWGKLVRQFFSSYPSASPFFRDIPKAFLDYIYSHQLLSTPLLQLADYEWAELAISHQQTSVDTLSTDTDLMNEQPILAAAHKLLAYDYPVHEMSASNPNPTVNPTYILMYRNQSFDVKFISLNPLTFELLRLLNTQQLSSKQALTYIAETIGHPQPQEIVTFGVQTLHDLMQQQAIVGSKPVLDT